MYLIFLQITFQLCIVGEHLLKVTEISTSYDLKPA